MRKPLLPMIAVLLMMGFAAFGQPPLAKEPWLYLLGRPAPEVKLETLDGGTFDLSSYEGEKIVVMDFWASWCQPCRILMPVIDEVAKAYEDKDVVFYGVNQREPKAHVKRYVEATGLELPMALDKDGKVSSAYRVNSIPRLVIVGKDGTVQSIHAGLEGDSLEQVRANAREKLSKELDKLLEGENLVEPVKPAKTEEPLQEAKKPSKTS